ncbi:unnamed protein product, partial [marine sediment metagenome]
SGYNGFARGADDENLPNRRPDKHEYMFHAERNILHSCNRKGTSTMGCILICTLSPCLNCLRACYQSGIKAIVFRDLYNKFDDDSFYEKLRDIDIEVSYIGNFTILEMRSIKEKIKSAVDNFDD